jgi:hypothetical protein
MIYDIVHGMPTPPPSGSPPQHVNYI